MYPLTSTLYFISGHLAALIIIDFYTHYRLGVNKET